MGSMNSFISVERSWFTSDESAAPMSYSSLGSSIAERSLTALESSEVHKFRTRYSIKATEYVCDYLQKVMVELCNGVTERMGGKEWSDVFATVRYLYLIMSTDVYIRSDVRPRVPVIARRSWIILVRTSFT
jgi:hypothetical protein